MKILVTGGAGYIGSHVVRALDHSGHDPVVLDDLSFGKSARIGRTPLVSFDLASSEGVDQLLELFDEHQIEAVIHLAARKSVAESVENPDYYQQQNVGGVRNLLRTMNIAGITKLVFSSSAAVYGSPENGQVDEDYPCKPINPYGETKLMGEELIAQAMKDVGLKAVALRYFNVAGAGYPDLADSSVANLIPIALNAMRTGQPVQVFGTDWPTPDGSCVRDYIHVSDLADAHVQSLKYLDQENPKHMIFNVGTGKGSSVLEVVNTLSQVAGKEIAISKVARRAGDPAALAAEVSRIKTEMGWQAKHNLLDIIQSAYEASSN